MSERVLGNQKKQKGMIKPHFEIRVRTFRKYSFGGEVRFERKICIVRTPFSFINVSALDELQWQKEGAMVL